MCMFPLRVTLATRNSPSSCTSHATLCATSSISSVHTEALFLPFLSIFQNEITLSILAVVMTYSLLLQWKLLIALISPECPMHVSTSSFLSTSKIFNWREATARVRLFGKNTTFNGFSGPTGHWLMHRSSAKDHTNARPSVPTVYRCPSLS